MIEGIKQRSLEDIRAIYKKYMNEQNLSKNTISTSLSDAFYLAQAKRRHILEYCLFRRLRCSGEEDAI